MSSSPTRVALGSQIGSNGRASLKLRSRSHASEQELVKSLGVAPGAPDLLLWHEGKSFAIEQKAEGGRTSDAQADMLDRLRKAGVLVAVGAGVDNAIAILEGWQLLKGTMQ